MSRPGCRYVPPRKLIAEIIETEASEGKTEISIIFEVPAWYHEEQKQDKRVRWAREVEREIRHYIRGVHYICDCTDWHGPHPDDATAWCPRCKKKLRPATSSERLRKMRLVGGKDWLRDDPR